MKKPEAPSEGARLEPAGYPAVPAKSTSLHQPSAAGVAWRLANLAAGEDSDFIYIASSERRAEETARALAGIMLDAEVLHLPAWDCLPFDRAAPSPEVMGKRMRCLRRCLDRSTRHILVLSSEAALQRVPPPAAVRAALELRLGDAFDRAAFERFALRAGYRIDDRVDEPGEIAMRGNVVEVYAADQEQPVRISDPEGLIGSIRFYDARSQRSLEEASELLLGPASELLADPERRVDGDEHRMSSHYGDLPSIFDYLPDAGVVLGEPVPDRIKQLHEQIDEAHVTARDLSESHPPTVSEVYVDQSAWKKLLSNAATMHMDLAGLKPVPSFSSERNPVRSLLAFIRSEEQELAIVVCGIEAERKRLRSALKRGGIAFKDLDGTFANVVGRVGVWLADVDVDVGFIDRSRHVAVVAAADVLGSRLNDWTSEGSRLVAPTELRVGDVVVHEDHGVGVLRDLTRVKTDGAEQDTIKLEYYRGATLLVPVADFGKLWRYGADEATVSLDRLNTDAWARKRASVSAEIEEAAKQLAKVAQRRLSATAVVLNPSKGEADRLAARFPFPETPDQTAAIAAVLADMASGHPMNRLICGDVGFGKTEVALRAAAAAALCGAQVAMIAPTTVLASQHLQSFERRFAGSGVSVGMLSRLATTAEIAETKERLRTGDLRIVVATHAIAADDVAFANLGLVIIDEEQRFGAGLKRKVEELARGAHLLAMSATPIPRSLQAAMIGLQDVSILATPPSRRRPIKTFLAPFELATARTALLREKRRGGQSFVVVPRIADIAVVAKTLSEAVPELMITIAHGEMAATDIDQALLSFASGKGDLLLATSIIESGLDVPRANTMLVCGADRFGLSQLHQLRGRVGRGRSQGITYLFTDPADDLSEVTRSRLSTLLAFDRLGSGFDISARDLELRGAGDLLGEDQAGHLHLIGSGLYQKLLERAFAAVKGEADVATAPAALNVGPIGSIPVDYVPEAVVRIDLYLRLQKFRRVDDIAAFAEELEDRFGPIPEETSMLLVATQVALTAGGLGVARIDAGPLGIALTPGPEVDVASVLSRLSTAPTKAEDRIVFSSDGGRAPIDALCEILGLRDEG